MIGFRASWTHHEQIDFEHAGIVYLLREPFSPSELDTAAYVALHAGTPAPRPNLFVFIPAKAGGGCSTAALHIAAALGETLGKHVLAIEGDARSGVFSIMLNVTSRLCLQDVLQRAGELTVVDWQQMHATAHGMDLVLANPWRPTLRVSWGEYFQMLNFVEHHYDSIVVDLPEVINDATAEVVRTAAKVFVVCTPELLSLKLANLRCQEIEAYGVPRGRVEVIVTRWSRDGISPEELEQSLGRPVYARAAAAPAPLPNISLGKLKIETFSGERSDHGDGFVSWAFAFAMVGNDYKEVRKAILESRLASPASGFGKDCRSLARRISSSPDEPAKKPRLGLLARLAR